MHFFKAALWGTSLCSLSFSVAASEFITPVNGTANAINGDGTVVVGGSDDTHTGFRWIGGTVNDLGAMPHGSYTTASAVNAAGNVVVGSGDNGGIGRAFRWVADGGPNGGGTITELGTLAGGSSSAAYGVNVAGDVVVGQSGSGNGDRAFRWVEDGGPNGGGTMTDLGTLAGGSRSTAYGVNAAGNVVVGQSSSGNGDHAFRWVEDGGPNGGGTMTSLGTLAGGFDSSASAVNAAGDVVVGTARNSNSEYSAFRWVLDGGPNSGGTMTDLGKLTGGTASFATGVNAAGNVVVGYSTIAVGRRAFRWTQGTGMQSVEEWLAANGVTVTGVSTYQAQGVSADGNTVVGTTDANTVFIARVTTSGGSGMIDADAFKQGLFRVANSGLLAANDAETTMNGLHSNPMRGLLGQGQSTMWVGGDIGRQTHGSYDSDLGIAEVGYGHRFNDTLQLNVSVGRTHSKADTGLGGATKAQSTFILPELVFSLPSSVYATISAYYGKGRSDIDRVYLNAGTPERSFADPSLTSIGTRVRFDWLNAASWGKTNLTPYASLTYMQTKMDAYSEQGVAFPVNWDARTERATSARVGLDAVRTVSDRFTVLGRVEAAHRFESSGSETTGQMVGLDSFRFAGQKINQTWLRVGAGFEAKLGEGIAGVMLNATTQGEAPSYWLSANYRWTF